MGFDFTQEQQRALAPDLKNRIVSAQAGAGKTGVLVGRILEEVERGVSLDQMLIVTFTKKAAGEMKDRICQGLAERLVREDADRPRLLRQLNLIASANIQTLHAFCLEMVQQHFDRLNRDPGVAILSGRQLAALRNQAMEEIFQDVYAESMAHPESPMADFLLRYRDAEGFGHRDLEAVIRQWSTHAREHEDLDAWSKKQVQGLSAHEDTLYQLTLDVCIGQVAFDVQEMLRCASKQLSASLPDAIIAFYQQEIATLESLLWGDQPVPEALPETFLPYLAHWRAHGFSYTFPRRPSIDKKNEAADVLERNEGLAKRRETWKKSIKKLADVFTRLDEASFHEELRAMAADLESVQEIATRYMARLDALKREAGGMEFVDVEHEMLALLRLDDVREALQRRYVRIFFDEYQDANAIQEAIIQKMANPHSLFFVGDVKQSIYGFRQAMPENFIRRYRAYADDPDAEAIDLTQNFRSQVEVLDFVNAICSALMTERRGGVDYDTPAHRAKAGLTPDGSGATDIVVLKEEERDESEVMSYLDEISSEAYYVSREIETHVRNGGHFKDCVVLARSSTRFREFEALFQQERIPYYNDKQNAAETSLETDIALHLISFIENQRADLPLMSSLLSLVGGFSEEDLAWMRIAHPTGPFYEAFLATLDEANPSEVPEELRHRIEVFIAWRREWKRRQIEMPLSSWVDALFLESGLYRFVAGMPDGAMRRRRLELIVRQAEVFESRGETDVMSFLEELRRKSESTGEDVKPTAPLSENDDVVRLMTIHGAKGLQFPVVFLVDANKEFNQLSLNQTMLTVKDVGTSMKLRHWDDAHRRLIKTTPLLHLAFREKLKEEMRAEEVRLLYVAMTRAERRLVIVGHTKDVEKLFAPVASLQQQLDADSSELDWIVHAASAAGLPIQVLEGSEVRAQVSASAIDGVSEMAPSLQQLKERLAFRYPHPEATHQPLKRTVSQLSKKNQILDEHFRAWPWLRFSVETPSLSEETLPSDEPSTSAEPITAEAGHAVAADDVTREALLQHFPLPAFMQEESVDAQTFGTLMHRALQNVSYREHTMESLSAELDAMQERELFTPAERQAIDEALLLRFFQSGLGKALIRHASEIERERSFTLRLETPEGTLAVDGQVDLYLEQEAEVVLVDFKTDRHPNPERYRQQLELYARAISLATHKPVTHCYLYWLRTGRADELQKRSVNDDSRAS